MLFARFDNSVTAGAWNKWTNLLHFVLLLRIIQMETALAPDTEMDALFPSLHGACMFQQSLALV